MRHLRPLLVLAALQLATALDLHAADALDRARWDGLMLDSVHALKNNQLERSVDLCGQALALAATFGPKDTHYARSQVLRAEIFLWQKRNAEAEQWFEAAVATCEQAVGPHDPELVHPLVSLANYNYYVAHRLERVTALFTRILDLVEHAPQRDDHQVIVWSRNLGLIYQERREFAQAEPLFARAIALAEKTDPGWVPHELLTAAECDRLWGHHAQAEALARRALALRERTLAAVPNNVDAKLDLVVTLDALSSVLVSGGNAPEAVAVSRRSLQLAESFMTAEQAEMTPRLSALAAAQAAAGELPDAAATYQRAVAIAGKNLGANDPQLGGLLADLAAVERRLQHNDDAAALERRAAAIRKQSALPL